MTYALAAVIVVGLGLLVRAPGLGLPWVVAKYGGSFLWAAMVYLLLRAILPGRTITRVALLAGILVALGECTQLISIPWFDAVRATTIGHLIFGRTFDVPDILAYWTGILLAVLGETVTLRSPHT